MDIVDAERIRAKQRLAQISLSRQYAEPLAQVLSAEISQKRWSDAIDMTNDSPSWRQLLATTAQAQARGKSLDELMLTVADASSSSQIIQMLNFTNDEIRWTQHNWALVSQKLREIIKRQSPPTEVAAAIYNIVKTAMNKQGIAPPPPAAPQAVHQPIPQRVANATPVLERAAPATPPNARSSNTATTITPLSATSVRALPFQASAKKTPTTVATPILQTKDDFELQPPTVYETKKQFRITKLNAEIQKKHTVDEATQYLRDVGLDVDGFTVLNPATGHHLTSLENTLKKISGVSSSSQEASSSSAAAAPRSVLDAFNRAARQKSGDGLKRPRGRPKKEPRRYRLIKGSGAIVDESLVDEGSPWARVNRLMVDVPKLVQNNTLRVRYVNKCNLVPSIPDRHVSDESKRILFQLLHGELQTAAFEALNDRDRACVRQFCEGAHIELPNAVDSAEWEQKRDVLVGAMHAGHEGARRRLAEFLLDSLTHLPKKQHRDVLEQIVALV